MTFCHGILAAIWIGEGGGTLFRKETILLAIIELHFNWTISTVCLVGCWYRLPSTILDRNCDPTRQRGASLNVKFTNLELIQYSIINFKVARGYTSFIMSDGCGNVTLFAHIHSSIAQTHLLLENAKIYFNGSFVFIISSKSPNKSFNCWFRLTIIKTYITKTIRLSQ